jgi:hypothetical protein
MKNLIFAISLISLPALSCPNLGGTYQVCRSQKNILIEGTDLKVEQYTGSSTAVFKMSMLPDGSRDREVTTLIANGSEAHDSWVGPTGIKYDRVMYGKCLGNLLQWHTEITADGASYVHETSQYFRQGEDLVRISRGHSPSGEKYFDILTCR